MCLCFFVFVGLCRGTVQWAPHGLWHNARASRLICCLVGFASPPVVSSHVRRHRGQSRTRGPAPVMHTRVGRLRASSLGQVLLASHDRGFVAFAFAAVQGDAVAASKLSHKSQRHTWHHGEFTRTSSPYHVVGRIMSHHGSCGGFVLECVSVCVSVLCMFSSVLPGLLAHRVGPRRSHHHTHELRYCNIISVISRTTIPFLSRHAV